MDMGFSCSSLDDEQDKGLLDYGLRETPKKSFRFADREFASSVVLQDRESETETSRNLITRRRSKRHRKLNMKMKCEKLWRSEPASSVSDTTTEEDVAFLLMMLSRDKWVQNQINEREKQEQEIEYSYESEEIEFCKITRNRTKYKCETCNKVFKSYQALGGHRASHKKVKTSTSQETEHKNGGTTMAVNRRIHECPVCYRVFSSGQALGGHKRSHLISSETRNVINSTKFKETLVDLNLPAPMDHDDEQFELSTVSYALI